MTWREVKKGPNKFSHTVQAFALGLSERMSRDIMLVQFIPSLLFSLRDLAIDVPPSFDKVTERVAMIFTSTGADIGSDK